MYVCILWYSNAANLSLLWRSTSCSLTRTHGVMLVLIEKNYKLPVVGVRVAHTYTGKQTPTHIYICKHNCCRCCRRQHELYCGSLTRLHPPHRAPSNKGPFWVVGVCMCTSVCVSLCMCSFTELCAFFLLVFFSVCGWAGVEVLSAKFFVLFSMLFFYNLFLQPELF